MNIATIHCDGSYSRLVQRAGYGVVVELNGKVTEFFEPVESNPSSLRAEMLGAIRAIEVFGPRCDRLVINSDSKMLIDGMTGLVAKWVKDKWSKGTANKDLWLNLLGLSKRYCIEWQWIKGHEGNSGNERADELAKLAVWGSV